MSSGFEQNIKEIVNGNNNLAMIVSNFHCLSFDDLLKHITVEFKNNISEIVDTPEFLHNYHVFLYELVDKCDDIEFINGVSLSLSRQIHLVKDLIKPYNKKEKAKDEFYVKLIRLKSDLQGNQTYAENKMFALYENDDVKVMKYIIFVLKDIDALFNIITTHKDIVNVCNTSDQPIVEIVMRYVIDNLKDLTENEIDYYKRVLTMIFFRKEFKLDNDKYDELMKELDYALLKEKCNVLEYMKTLLKRYNGHSLEDSSIHYSSVVLPPVEERTDLRDLDTITLDYIRYPKGTKILYDDALSYEELPDGTIYLYMHTPDVGEYIEIGSSLDEYIQKVGLSRYSEKDNRPMIPYNIANKMSLIEGEDRCALTYRFHLTPEGILLGVDYIKSIIKVNTNLPLSKAEVLIRDKGYGFNPLLKSLNRISKNLRKMRHERIGNRSKAGLIMDETNIWSNLFVAQDAFDRDMLFPYKNLLVNESDEYPFYIKEFLNTHNINEDAKILLSTILSTKPRTYFSTTPRGNHQFDKMFYCSTTNPLREYMSLETGRLIKDLIIDEKGNEEMWEERIKDDCVRCSEQEAKVKELYKTI